MADANNAFTQPVTNFLVPATGSTNAYAIRQNFTATPQYVQFNDIALEGIPFRPSGLIIDNGAGTEDLVVLVNEIGLAISCPAGEFLNMPFPAPLNCTFNITGNGVGVVVFVDYPVIPWSSEQAGGGSSGGLTNAQLRAAPVPVALITPDPFAVEIGASATLLDCSWTLKYDDSAVAAGAVEVTFVNTGAADGTVGTTFTPLKVGQSLTFTAPAGSRLNAVAYNAFGTEFSIAVTR